MKKLLTATLPISLICAMTATSPAQAGFGDFLKKLEDKGAEIIQESQQSPSGSTSVLGQDLDYQTIINGLKEALDVGSRRAIDSISQQDGYFANPQIRIPLPDELERASSLMKQFGLKSQVEAFELSMNRAAEKAAPQATAIIIDAIKAMSIDDARTILNGPDNAATEYFRDKTAGQLTALFKPSIKTSMDEVGVTRYYGDLTKEAEALPMVGNLAQGYKLEDHVTQAALDGLFTMLAAEEKLIRENPTARTTDLLKQVFNL